MITLLPEDEPLEWANQFGLDHPVVRDPNYDYTMGFIDGNSIALPSMTLIAPGGEVVIRNDWVSESDVTKWLP